MLNIHARRKQRRKVQTKDMDGKQHAEINDDGSRRQPAANRTAKWTTDAQIIGEEATGCALKMRKSPGDDGISLELQKARREEIMKMLVVINTSTSAKP